MGCDYLDNIDPNGQLLLHKHAGKNIQGKPRRIGKIVDRIIQIPHNLADRKEPDEHFDKNRSPQTGLCSPMKRRLPICFQDSHRRSLQKLSALA
jgi:hypothetical protein